MAFVKSSSDDALRGNHVAVAQLLAEHGGRSGGKVQRGSRMSSTGNVVPDAATIELIYAVSSGDLDAVRTFVARGVDLGSCDYDLRTPLHLAAAEGHKDVVGYFVEQGVSAEVRDRWGATPADEAMRHGFPEIAESLHSASGALTVV